MERNKRYRNILEKVYEVEGLLLLAMSKEETPEGLDSLIERRIAELLEDEEAEQAQEEPTTYYAIEDEDEETVVPEVPRRERKRSGGVPEMKRVVRKLPVLSLNDRYLFLRELFGGDTIRFGEALNGVADCDTFGEARELLTEEYGLNPDTEEPDGRFLTIIEDYFLSR